MKTCMTILFAFIFSATAASGQTTILWNESVNGELSQDFNSPTPFGALQLGTNSIIGATEIVPYGNNWGAYPEFFTFEVPSNSEVTALYIQIDKPDVWAWIGDPTFSNELAFDVNPSIGELLSQWGLDSISPGLYGMYLLNADEQSYTTIANYQLDFVLEPIPEPGILGLLLLSAGVFTLRHCRKFRL
jgi:hypothetical protein